jgi:hypothetical protein
LWQVFAVKGDELKREDLAKIKASSIAGSRAWKRRLRSSSAKNPSLTKDGFLFAKDRGVGVSRSLSLESYFVSFGPV